MAQVVLLGCVVMQNLLFRQLFDKSSSTYTYLLADADTREACIIDPVPLVSQSPPGPPFGMKSEGTLYPTPNQTSGLIKVYTGPHGQTDKPPGGSSDLSLRGFRRG